MSFWATIILIIAVAAIIGVMVEALRLWLHDDELEQEERND